ncbi:hypothetical protein Q5530_07125 [Saccharothrix sp. BKS2]|uniref:hypothetical protein n=1 Tax=Saccharothrix sp. BKS2 TaxID=3064400 RepID=UPI0039EAF3DC
MTVHLSDADLALLARGGQETEPHLARCPDCRLRWHSWQQVATATRTAVAPLGSATPPPFDSLAAVIGLRPEPLPVAGQGLFLSWSAIALLVVRQVRLMPRTLLPISVVGIALAVFIGLATSDQALGKHLYAAVVALVAVLGSLTTCSRRTDPRNELLCAMPVSPVAVLASRLLLVLTTEVVLAVAGSVAVRVLGEVAPVLDLVSSWFGQMMLASAIAVVGSVWRSPGFGGGAAVAVWLLGSLTTMPGGELSARAGVVAQQVWGTTPWTLVAAAVLLAIALRRVWQFPGRTPEPA